LFLLSRLKINIVFFGEHRYIGIYSIKSRAWKERGYSYALKMADKIERY
jgi:hypothetical protein